MTVRRRTRAGFTLLELLISTTIASVIGVAAVLYVSRIHREIAARNVRVELEAEADRVHEWLARDAAHGENVTVGADGQSLTIELLGARRATYHLAGQTLTRLGPHGQATEGATLVLSTRVKRWDLRSQPGTIDTLLALEEPEQSEILRHVSQMAVPLSLSREPSP